MAGTITHSWNGTVLTITSDSGTSSADLKGDTGIRGAQGIQGLKGERGAGEKGDKGDAFKYEDFTPEQLEALRGAEGAAGKDGRDGEKGDRGDTGLAGRTSAYNILDNSNFKVNQRGQTTYTGNGKYTVDKWSINGNNLSIGVSADYITLTNTNANGRVPFSQGIERNIYTGKPLTVAICEYNTGNIYTATNIVPDATTATQYICIANFGGSCARLELNQNNELSFQIMAGKSETINIKWVALYEGAYEAENLPPYIPKGYAAELTECRRYTQKLAAYAVFRSSLITKNYVQTIIPIAVPFRITPSIESGTLLIKSLSNTTVEGFTFSIAASGDNCIRIDAYKENHGLTDACLRFDSAVIVTADLDTNKEVIEGGGNIEYV